MVDEREAWRATRILVPTGVVNEKMESRSVRSLSVKKNIHDSFFPVGTDRHDPSRPNLFTVTSRCFTLDYLFDEEDKGEAQPANQVKSNNYYRERGP